MALKGSLSFIIPIFMLFGQSLNYEIKRYHDPANYTHTPIVFIHGITSNCVELQHLVGMVSDLMNNTAYTKCIEVGNGKISSWFMDMRTQVQSACQGIMADPVFSSGVPVNIIGYSQGGLIARSVVETCTAIKFRKLMTFGSPHGGVSAIHKCDYNFYCILADKAAKMIVYSGFAQMLVAPADYFRVFTDLANYLKKSYFLPIVNNEETDPSQKNPQYRQRLVDLEHFRMFMWLDDYVVYPKESEWFGVFDENGYIVNLQDQEQYKQDWLGLRTLGESNRTSFLTIEGGHMNIESWYVQQNLIPLLID